MINKQHIAYVFKLEKGNWIRAAYEGLVDGKGDCYHPTIFMWTEAQMMEYSNKHSGSHNYGHCLYPMANELKKRKGKRSKGKYGRFNKNFGRFTSGSRF